jgi:hypothetical protein
VKSAYHVLADAVEQSRKTQQGETSAQGAGDSIEDLWKRLWRLNCWLKIKQFIWLVAHNSLALKLCIKRRHIDLDTRCPVCWRMDDDGGHCFLKCKYVH